MNDAANDVQGDVTDAVKLVEEVSSALDSAENCESVDDLIANLREAEAHLKAALKEVKALADRALAAATSSSPDR